MFLSFKLVVTKKTVSSLRDCLIAKGSMETTGPPSILKYSALSIELARLNSPDKFFHSRAAAARCLVADSRKNISQRRYPSLDDLLCRDGETRRG